MRVKGGRNAGGPGDEGGAPAAANAAAPAQVVHHSISATALTSSTLEHCKNHPRMLKSNATSHVWSLGALAELIDNAQDDEAKAKNVYVSGGERDGVYAITVEDDGVGMTRPKLHCMLSFGFSQKEHLANNVGRFGIGFKSGSMRLGKDVIVFTREDNTASVALLSQTFLDAVSADDILIPMFTWSLAVDVDNDQRLEYKPIAPEDPSDWASNMSILTQYSRYKSEDELVEFMESMPARRGTSITIYNLKEPLEFDFSSEDDICVRDFTNDDLSRSTTTKVSKFQQHRDGQMMSLDVPEDYSLRKYMEILFLRPRVNLFLQGVPIEFRCPIARMDLQRHTFPEYKPHGYASGITLHFGYANDNTKHCGTHIYHKNRLIRMYQRFGSQLQANCMMKDMLGVAEAECLTPTHNKQAFDESHVIYARFKTHMHVSMQKYYYHIQTVRTAGGGGRGRGAPKRKATGKKRDKYGDLSSDSDDDDRSYDSDDQPKVKRKPGRPPKNPPEDLHAPIPEVPGEPPGLGQCAQILARVIKHKEAWPFLEPVDVVAYGCPDYYEIIKRPMDFGTIRRSLEEGRYASHHDFKVDADQVFLNALTFNGPEGEVTHMAQRVQSLFDEHWNRLQERVAAYGGEGAGAGGPAPSAAQDSGVPYGEEGMMPVAQDPNEEQYGDEDEGMAEGMMEGPGGVLVPIPPGGVPGGAAGIGAGGVGAGGGAPRGPRPPRPPGYVGPSAEKIRELGLEVLEERARREAAEASAASMKSIVEGLQQQLRVAASAGPVVVAEAGGGGGGGGEAARPSGAGGGEDAEDLEFVRQQNEGLVSEVQRLQEENDRLSRRAEGAEGGGAADAARQWLEAEVKRLRAEHAGLAARAQAGAAAEAQAAALRGESAQLRAEAERLGQELERARAAPAAPQPMGYGDTGNYFQLQVLQLEQQNGELREESQRAKHAQARAEEEAARAQQELAKLRGGLAMGLGVGGGVQPVTVTAIPSMGP